MCNNVANDAETPEKEHALCLLTSKKKLNH